MLVVVLVDLIPGLAITKVDPIEDAGMLQRGDRAQDGGEVGAWHKLADAGMEVVK